MEICLTHGSMPRADSFLILSFIMGWLFDLCGGQIDRSKEQTETLLSKLYDERYLVEVWALYLRQRSDLLSQDNVVRKLSTLE